MLKLECGIKKDIGRILVAVRMELFRFLSSNDFKIELEHEGQRVWIRVEACKKRHLEVVD